MMSIKKAALALSVVSLFAVNVQAAEPQKNTNQKNTTQKSTTNQKSNSATKNTGNTKSMNNTKNTDNKTKAAPNAEQKNTSDADLNAFNKNVKINLIQRGMAKQDNQDVVVLTYEVNNIGRNRIKNLNWISAFTINEQVFFVQEIQTELEKAISSKKKENITVILPLNTLPENVKPAFVSLETPIGHLTVAKQIDFTNGKKIEVKE